MNQILENLKPYDGINWGGICFVLVMLAFIVICAVATQTIRRRSNYKDPKPRGTFGVLRASEPTPQRDDWHRDVAKDTADWISHAGRADTDEVFAPKLSDIYAEWRKENEEESRLMITHQQAIMRGNVQYLPAEHEHVIDFERSRMTVLEDSAMLAQCCVSGCKVVVRIGRGMTQAILEDMRVKA